MQRFKNLVLRELCSKTVVNHFYHSNRTVCGMFHRDSYGGGKDDRRGQHYRHGNTRGNRGRGQSWHQRRHAGSGRGNRQDHGAEEGAEGFERPQRERERPPPGLSGREIGLWHARKNRLKKENMRKHQRPDVSLEEGKRREITQLLHGIRSSRECPPQPDRFYNDIDIKSEEGDDWFESDISRPSSSASSTASVNFGVANVKVKEEIKEEVDEAPDVAMVTELLQYNKEEDLIVKGEEDEDLSQFQLSPVRDIERQNRSLSEDFQWKQSSTRYQDMQGFRQRLPSFKDRKKIVDMIASNQVVVLSGETGCGKTTQVPQYILDDYIGQNRGAECRILCTQPRRISAISVAERVAVERGEDCGNSVGYMIRFEHKMPRDYGSIMYCTTGILLKMLESDKLLSRATHIVLDEIHERDLLSDFLIIILKDILQQRPDLKLVLMSATLNAEDFSQYYGNCPMVKIPGFTYPVEEFLLEDVIELLQYRVPDNMMVRQPRRFGKRRNYEEEAELDDFGVWLRNLEGGVNTQKRYHRETIKELSVMDTKKIDKDLIVELIRYITFNKDEGAILVFVPGWGEISDIHKMLMADPAFNSSTVKVIPLHSMMPTVNQRDVFNRPPPGIRKIVIATNIAETSITIDDVVYVIDGGRIKVKGFNAETNMASLDAQLVSKANAKQRRGRAGRVQSGECYHLYTGYHESVMDAYLKPEILRTRLEELCLQIKYLKLGEIIPFVSKAMEPPSLLALQKAIVTLQNLNALDKQENLLPLGKHLARMPLDPHSGKMILFGAMFGCLDPILTIVASLSFKDPFFLPLEKKVQAEQAKMDLAEDCASDHILLVKTYKKWERARRRGTSRQFCWDHFLSENTLVMLQKMRQQLADILQEMGFITNAKHLSDSVNVNSGNEDLIKAIVSAGLYPNVANIFKFATKHRSVTFRTQDGTKCELHPGSVAKILRDPKAQWVVYHKMMKTTNVFVYDCSVVSPYSLLFFGGDIHQLWEDGYDLVCVDDWIKFKASPDTVKLVKDLRHELDLVLDEKIRRTSETNWSSGSKEGAVLKAIIDLVTSEAAQNDYSLQYPHESSYYKNGRW